MIKITFIVICSLKANFKFISLNDVFFLFDFIYFLILIFNVIIFI